jgi:transcriptional regulator with XRE-family HTH domain
MRLTGGWSSVWTLLTLLRMRRAVRVVRRERELTLDTVSEQSGVDRAAIHKIERTDKYPNYEPGLETFRRLVELGLDVPLHEFLARLVRESEQPVTTRDVRHVSRDLIQLVERLSDEGQREAIDVLAPLVDEHPRARESARTSSGADKTPAQGRK